METNQDNFGQIFIRTTNFINNLKSKPVTITTQEDIDFVHGKIHNLTIWLSGSCDLMYLDFAEEVESIIGKIYDKTTIQEYSNCIQEICNPINLETLTDLTNELEINLIQPDIKPIQSSVTIEELFGGQKDKNHKHLRMNLLFIIIFSVLSVCLIQWSYLILSGQVRPTIGQTVYTLGGKYSSPKPYIIKSEYQIYEFLITRLFACIGYLFLTIFLILNEVERIESELGKISFVKLLNLTFDEQNQFIKYITNKIEQNNQITPVVIPVVPKQTIEIPELKMIKVPKTKLSLTHPDIFIKENEIYKTTQAVKITNVNGDLIKQTQEYNQAKFNEIKEVEKKKNLFKLMTKCIPSIFKKVKKVKK